MPHEITVTTDGLFRIVCDDRGYGLFVGGKPLWEMVGGASDTCGGWFSLVDEPLRPRTPDEINERLGRGVDAVDGALVESIVPLLPRGRYTVGLLRAAPIRQRDADNWYRCRCVEREILRQKPIAEPWPQQRRKG